MTKQELYLKTMFCCMACDGNIAQEEIELVKNTAMETSMFEELDVETALNTYVSAINKNGVQFLRRYLKELSEETLTTKEALQLVGLAVRVIDADSRTEYSEVKFFKKIRSRLSVSDDQILRQHPDKEEFLLPDIDIAEELVWDEDITFSNICLN